MVDSPRPSVSLSLDMVREIHSGGRDQEDVSQDRVVLGISLDMDELRLKEARYG